MIQRPQRRDPEALESTYHGHLVCGECLRPKRVHTNRVGYSSYHCDRRYTTCQGKYVSIRSADSQLHVDLERILGDPRSLEQLLNQALREQKQQAAPSATELGRRITLLENKRARGRDAYEAGVYDLRELQKREAALDEARTSIEALMVADDIWEPTDELVDELVQVFGGWAGLPRAHKRALLREWRVEIIGRIEGPKRKRWFEIERVRTGALPAQVWLYKKMKRLNVE